MITEIAFVVYPVTDVPRARRFYEEVLGLKLENNWENKWVEYDIKGGTFAITSWLEENKPGVQGGQVAFEVDDLDAFVGRLKARGVSLTREILPTPVCRMAVVSDPDGNRVVIHQRHRG
jgi:predicted enzyme related to lactoylglutathione lyase